MTLTTPRLILRPWTENDAPALYRHASNPALGQAAGWPPHTSVEESLNIIRTVFSAPETYAIILKSTGEPIGCCGLLFGQNSNLSNIPDSEAEIGYWLAQPYWGQAITPEAANALIDHAFTTLSLSKIWPSHYIENTRSQRLAQKCGFTYHHTSIDTSTTPPRATLFHCIQNPNHKRINAPSQKEN